MAGSFSRRFIFPALASIVLGGCQTTGFGPGTPTVKPGQNAPSAAISGGGLIGAKLGATLDRKDLKAGLEAEYKALEYGGGGEIVTWAGPGGKASGKVVAAQPYRVGSQDCRQYSHELTLSGAVSNARGTACRNGDGTWTLLE